MKFGRQPLAVCRGTILAHGCRTGAQRLAKGHILDAADLAALEAAGISELVVAIIEPGEVSEDIAASRIAAAAKGPNLEIQPAHKGRANVESTSDGLLILNSKILSKINSLNEGLTVASLNAFAPVKSRGLVASIKVIPFALPEDIVAEAEAILRDDPMLRVAPFRQLKTGLIQSTLPAQPAKARDKTRRLVGWRLAEVGSTVDIADQVPHEAPALTDAINRMIKEGVEMLLIHGASATVDRRDVVPSAIVAAGGTIERLGMPVDPGNLLVLGRIGEVPVIGLPGCAGSPKLNGLDWVLERLVAGLEITPRDFAAMGQGGLLKETPDRPQPRRRALAPSATSAGPARGAILLAAGSSERMGRENKLLSLIDRAPLVQKALASLRGAEVDSIVVVLGHQAEAVRAALSGDDLTLVENPDFADGLATSLKCGLRALLKAEAVVVMLADMPDVRPQTIDQLFERLDPDDGVLAAVPTWQGKRGNPVVWHRALFDELLQIEGDQGARGLFEQYAAFVAEVPVDDPGVCLDVDTEEALKALGNKQHGDDDPA